MAVLVAGQTMWPSLFGRKIFKFNKSFRPILLRRTFRGMGSVGVGNKKKYLFWQASPDLRQIFPIGRKWSGRLANNTASQTITSTYLKKGLADTEVRALFAESRKRTSHGWCRLVITPLRAGGPLPPVRGYAIQLLPPAPGARKLKPICDSIQEYARAAAPHPVLGVGSQKCANVYR